MDHCCGLTMVARLQNVFTEGSVLMQDVPILFCPTCHHSVIAPEIELDYQIYAHHCATDGIRSASLPDAIGDERILQILDKYPEDIRVATGQRVVQEQIDMTLDLMNFAKQIDDQDWYQELVERLRMFRELSNVTRQ
ncbi:hypothetical protein [Effusibacillus pohliae]|uniref:hypothetical protein n=1 Tax=Effusibacillus pohliae TaxID=232270 RepID=UPI000366B718|nr:hypothetical protein [Effusibacillus pohliae]